MDKSNITSFDDLIGIISSHKKEDITLYRGQNSNFPLLPKIARNDPTKNTSAIEKKMLAELRRRGDLHLNNSYDDWDLLVIAQHYGMSTRLLDWTTNPLVALWFSFQNAKPNKSTYVYAFLPSSDSFLDKNKHKTPFSPKNTTVFRPRLNNERIVAQNGWFTAHRYSRKTNSFVPLEKNKVQKEWILEMKVPPKLRDDLLVKMDVLGVNSQSIYPGIEGVCNHVNWLHGI